MENCCRTCLSEKTPNSNEMKLLSTMLNNTSLSIADMLVNVVSINKEITSDETTLKICSSCELNLITAYNFKIVCQKTEKILLERYATQTIFLSTSPDDEIKSEIIIDKENNSTDENETDNNTVQNESTVECKVKLLKTSNEKKSTVKKIEEKRKRTKPTKRKIKKSLSLDNIKTDSKASNIDLNSQTSIKSPRNKHKNRKPSVYCKKCDMKFEKESFYRKHCKQTHWQSYPCSICGKIFLQNRITRHMEIHATEKNHICTVCNASFTTTQSLRDHSRIHSGEKRYKCEHCDETFVHWNSRKNHIYKIHTREKKYVLY